MQNGLFSADRTGVTTAIRPREKNGSLDRPDVDLYVVGDGPAYVTTPSSELDALYAALDRSRTALGITKLKRNRVALSVSMSKADLDVSVLIERQIDDLYRIGNRVTGEWYKTDPEAHTSWSSAQNTRFSGRFKPMTKLLKWARREKPTQHRHPKSLALEGFLAENLDIAEQHYGTLFRAYCDTFLTTYRGYRELSECPRLDDPAVPGGNLLAGVSGIAFGSYYDKIQKHRDDAALALAQEDEDEATKYWRRIFRPALPRCEAVGDFCVEAGHHDVASHIQRHNGCTIQGAGQVCVMVWWISDPERLSKERRAVGAIDQGWFENPEWSLGQSVSTEADVRYRVATFPVSARNDVSQHVPGVAA